MAGQTTVCQLLYFHAWINKSFRSVVSSCSLWLPTHDCDLCHLINSWIITLPLGCDILVNHRKERAIKTMMLWNYLHCGITCFGTSCTVLLLVLELLALVYCFGTSCTVVLVLLELLALWYDFFWNFLHCDVTCFGTSRIIILFWNFFHCDVNCFGNYFTMILPVLELFCTVIGL